MTTAHSAARWSLALALFLLACGAPKQSTERVAAESTTAPPATSVHLDAAQITHGAVRWGTAASEVVATSVTVPAEVVPNEDRTARLGAPARGRVVTVHVAQGDRVHRGAALVTLESTEASAAESELAKAGAQLASQRAEASYAASARARAERLLTLTAIPRQEFERAVANDSLAQAMLHQAESELRRARQAAAALGVDGGRAGSIIIRSPLDGVVLLRTAMPGTVVEAGAALVTVSDLATLWVTAAAPEGLSAVRRGAAVRFTVAAFPNDTFAGRLEAVGPGLDAVTRTLPLRAAVGNGDGRLRPEMLATLTIEGGRAAAAVVLPEDAVQLLDGRAVVFLALPDGKGGARFTVHSVTVGSRQQGKVALSGGISSSDIVVLHGAFAVKAQLQKGAMPAMEM